MVTLRWSMSSIAKISVHSLFLPFWLLQHQALSSTCQSFSLHSQENCKTWQLHFWSSAKADICHNRWSKISKASVKCFTSNTKYAIPSARFTIPNTKYTIPNSQYTIPNSKYLIPISKYTRNYQKPSKVSPSPPTPVIISTTQPLSHSLVF